MNALLRVHQNDIRGSMAIIHENDGGEGAEFIHAEMLDPADEGGRKAGGGRERSVIPVGIFLLLFFIEAAMAVGASLAYFVYRGSAGIREIESFVRSRAIPLARELSEEAGASLKKKDYSGLRSLLAEKRGQGLLDEGFLLLADGRRAVHVAGRDGGESPGDRWSHSAELILAPARKKSGETMMIDYTAPAAGLPYDADIRLLLRRFLYTGIDSNAWLVTRAVYDKKGPAGAVGFVIGKREIFDFIENHVRFSLRVLVAGLGVALAISLFISFVVFFRYRSLRRGGAGITVEKATARDEFFDVPLPEATRNSSSSRGGAPFRTGAGIRDAIPVNGKE